MWVVMVGTFPGWKLGAGLLAGLRGVVIELLLGAELGLGFGETGGALLGDESGEDGFVGFGRGGGFAVGGFGGCFFSHGRKGAGGGAEDYLVAGFCIASTSALPAGDAVTWAKAAS